MASYRKAAAAVLALATLGGCGSSDPVSGGSSTPQANAAPKTRYDLANHCYVLKSAANGYVKRDGAGYSATAASPAEAEPFYMKPTALGRYLFHAHDSVVLSTDGSGVGSLEQPEDGSDWTVDTTGPGRYVVTSGSAGQALATDGAGKLVMATAPSTFSFVPATGCTAYPELSTDSVGETYKGSGVNKPVVGFAEVHTHMAMGHEMSDGTGNVGPSAGGVLYGQMYHRFGVPHALENCQAYHGVNGLQDPEALILDMTPLTMHDTQGWPSFVDWPGNVSQLHQAMYYKWVERAYKAGLRVMVSEGTNIAALCEVARIYASTINPQALTYDCNDMSLGINQVKYAMMLAENWCGDVHRNSPLIAHVCEALQGCDLRVFFRDKETDLRDTFLNNGYQSIPIVVFFDQSWNEIGRWVERAHAATGKAALIRSTTLDKAPNDKASQDAAMNEFRSQVASAYQDGKFWRAAANEVKLLLEARVGAKK